MTMVNKILKVVRRNPPVFVDGKFSAKGVYNNMSIVDRTILTRMINTKYTFSGKWSKLTPRLLYGYKLLHNIQYNEWALEPELIHFMHKDLYEALVVGINNYLYFDIVNQTGSASDDNRDTEANVLSVDDWSFVPKELNEALY